MFSIKPWYLLALLLVFTPAPVRADGDRTARVSDVRGTLSLRGEDEDDVSAVYRNTVVRAGDTLWTDRDSLAELELEERNWIRLSESAKLEIRSLNGGTEFRLWAGSVYFDRSGQPDRAFHLLTPAGDVDLYPDSVVRIDLGNDTDARVTVWSGETRVTPDRGDPVRVRSSERVYLNVDSTVETPERFDRADRDGFDRYHRERIDYWIDRPPPRELERSLPGAGELRDHGTWVTVEGVSYWQPYVAPDWRPYSRGYWSDVPGWGYTWVDYHPWGYVTCHYGRWLYRPVHGWLWYPGYAWSPGWVYWGTWGDYYGWAPLDPWGRPSYYGPGTFTYVGVIIDFGSWTFCHRDRFYYGRHHWQLGRDRRHLHGGHDLRLDPRHFRTVRDVYSEIGIPRHRVRGLTDAKDGRPARERVLDLENGLPPARQQQIQRRFQVIPNRDSERAARPGEVGRLQAAPSLRIDPGQLLRGRDAAERLRPSTPAVRPQALPPGSGTITLPLSGRDDPFRRRSPAASPPRSPQPGWPSSPRLPSRPSPRLGPVSPPRSGMPATRPGAPGMQPGGPGRLTTPVRPRPYSR